ncbi:MAG TPA: GAF domain-containing SpoIIE family protein phosphatase [Thermopolyspora sp.]|jgi:Serine phosphatase RsbU, regulator of sigma subunit
MAPPADFADTVTEVKLRNIQAITDAALAHLGLEDLLGELLERVREILEADAAVVLLLDHSRRHLVATAARGIEEEVRQSVRVPVGKGFAGRIAAERRPVIVEDVSGADFVNPLLVRKGLRSLLGVPLVASGTLLGVLHVGTRARRRFTDGEVELLKLVADRAALAAHALLSESERTAALELQWSLLPSALPSVAGVEMAARYSPGQANVGGDWYDVFNLPTGELCVVMGDVSGHGLEAAVIMGRMRSALRAYALESRDPAEVLYKLDRKMHHFEPDAMATVQYAVCDPSLKWAKLSSAGHMPPVFARPGQPSVALYTDVIPDLVIGADKTVPRHTSTLRIPPGALLCFYTDGLVERRDISIDTGVARLCATVHCDHPDAVCAMVMGTLIGHEPVQDDVALLVLRRDDSGR